MKVKEKKRKKSLVGPALPSLVGLDWLDWIEARNSAIVLTIQVTTRFHRQKIYTVN